MPDKIVSGILQAGPGSFADRTFGWIGELIAENKVDFPNIFGTMLRVSGVFKCFGLMVGLTACLAPSNLQAVGATRGFTSTQVFTQAPLAFKQPLPAQGKAGQKAAKPAPPEKNTVKIAPAPPKPKTVVDKRQIYVTGKAVDKKTVHVKTAPSKKTPFVQTKTAKAIFVRTPYDPIGPIPNANVRTIPGRGLMEAPKPKPRRHALGDWP